MTEQQFRERALSCERRLYRMSYMLLGSEADCADAVQEALFKAWRGRDKLRREEFFETWLTRILINECRSALRRRRTTVPIELIPEPAAPPDADPTLHDAIARLDEKLRLCVVLYYLEGYSVSEIARMLLLPSGTVKTRLTRARAALRNELTDETERRPR